MRLCWERGWMALGLRLSTQATSSAEAVPGCEGTRRNPPPATEHGDTWEKVSFGFGAREKPQTRILSQKCSSGIRDSARDLLKPTVEERRGLVPSCQLHLLPSCGTGRSDGQQSTGAGSGLGAARQGVPRGKGRTPGCSLHHNLAPRAGFLHLSVASAEVRPDGRAVTRTGWLGPWEIRGSSESAGGRAGWGGGEG